MQNLHLLTIVALTLIATNNYVNCAILTGSDKVSLVNDIFNLKWSIDDMAKTITFTMDCAITGWVGMGFSSNQKRPNSDMYLGYVDKVCKHS